MNFNLSSFKEFCEINNLNCEQATIIILEKIGEIKQQLEGKNDREI